MRFRPPFGKQTQTAVDNVPKVPQEEEQRAASTSKGPPARRKPPMRAATSPALQLHQSDTVKKQSKKRIMQDFFRSLRPPSAAGVRAPAKTQHDHRSRVSKPNASGTRRNSRHAISQDPSKPRSRTSFDISDDVLDRLMGPPKSVKDYGGRDSIQSDQFFVKQRIKATSRKASANGTIASNGPAQAQKNNPQMLGAEEIEQLLSGMPCFSVIAHKPKVSFRVVNEVPGVDWQELGHRTFGLCTLSDRVRGSKSAKYGTQELPDMLSANGLDPGTVGFEHFLQMPMADSDALPDRPKYFERRKLLVNKPALLGLRKISVEALIDRLFELDNLRGLQRKDRGDGKMLLNEKRIEEMGEDLFRRVVDSNLGISAAGTGSVTLRTQVEALQKVLNEEEVWFDLSQPKWRLRVGQLLWAANNAPLRIPEDEMPSNRDALLLQITLAAELLVRLDASEDLAEQAGSSSAVSQEDRLAIFATPSSKVQWDLVLAERFLDNLRIAADVQDSRNKSTRRASLFSAISFVTAKTSGLGSEPVVEPVFQPKAVQTQLDGLLHFAEAIRWPHTRDIKEKLQKSLSADKAVTVEGRALQLPERRASGISGLSVYATPQSSPTLPPQIPDFPVGNFKLADISLNVPDTPIEQTARRLSGQTYITTNHKVQLQAPGLPNGINAFSSMGWISRSWLSGLVLPGDSANCLLFSGLLENSPDAMQILGDYAYLEDGFQYAGYMYWSKKNVLGRVLAPNKGAKECMGWVSMPIGGLVEGSRNKDGWIGLEVREAPSRHAIRARLQKPQAVADDSDPFCGLDIGNLHAKDFVWPLDGPLVMGNEVNFYGLSFRERSISGQRLSSAADLAIAGGSPSGAQEANLPHEKKQPKRNMAKLSFGSPIKSKLPRLELLILYNVHFITSYPCNPPSARSRPNSRPLSVAKDGIKAPPSVAGSEEPGPTDSGTASATTQINAAGSSYALSLKEIEKELPPPPAHPLHVSYTFDVVPVAVLLSAHPDARSRAVSRAEERSKSAVAEEVVVLDCRGTEDLEVLARAWCAKIGENALIGQSGRTCLACCVREARALGLCVVIRT